MAVMVRCRRCNSPRRSCGAAGRAVRGGRQAHEVRASALRTQLFMMVPSEPSRRAGPLPDERMSGKGERLKKIQDGRLGGHLNRFLERSPQVDLTKVCYRRVRKLKP